MFSIDKASAKGIEQAEECALPAHGDGDVIDTKIPIEFCAEEICDGLAKAAAACGGLVVAEHVFQFAWCGTNSFDLLAPECIHFGDVGGLTAAEHVHFGTTGCERMS